MRDVRVLLTGIFVFFTVTQVMAAPAYGTKMPKKGEVFWGYQHHAVLDRDLNKNHGSMTSQQDHILLSYGVADWLSLDLKASRGTFTHKASDGDSEKYTKPLWGGGYGFRVRLFEKGPWKAVAGFQHISIHPEPLKGNGVKHTSILDDWQVSSLVSYSLRPVTPYVGVRYGTLDYIHYTNNDGDRHLTDERRRTDLILGCDIPVTDRVWVNLEGQGGAGQAVSASLNFHF